jgi:hypothetical protein
MIENDAEREREVIMGCAADQQKMLSSQITMPLDAAWFGTGRNKSIH